jgi:FkbM family methyltransferase
MREQIWLRLRNSNFLRRLYKVPALAPIMKAASLIVLPSTTEKYLEIRSGPGKGLRLELNPRWEFGIWEGTFEDSMQRVAQNYLGPGKTLYDVGGGRGFYSLLAASQGARSFAFEPDPFNLEWLQRHIRVNHFEELIEVSPLAIYSHTGSIAMSPSERNGTGQGCAKVLPHGSKAGGNIEVACITLDDFARANAAPSLVKIDVEGAESEVLNGAVELCREVRPPLLIEVHDPVNSSRVQKWLQQHQYRLEWLEDPNRLPSRLLATAL